MCQYIDKQAQPSFVFGELTLVDFFFMECCFYLNGFYYGIPQTPFPTITTSDRVGTLSLDLQDTAIAGGGTVAGGFMQIPNKNQWAAFIQNTNT